MKFRIAGNLRILKESIMARTTKKTTDNSVVCRIVDLIRKRGKKEKRSYGLSGDDTGSNVEMEI